MPYSRVLHWFAVSLFLSCFPAVPASAETIELVTYYPAPAGSGNLSGTSLAINYPVTTPAIGTAIISGPVGIGTNAPVGNLHIGESINSALETQLLLSNRGGDNHAAGIGFQVADVSEYTTYGPKAGIVFERQVFWGGGALKFFNSANNTTAAGFTAADERMRITRTGNVGIGATNPQAPLQVGASNLFVQNDQGGNIELGGNATIANPVVGGMPYIDFHFGRVVGGVTVAEDFNTRLINRADGILDVQTSTGGAAAQTRLSIGNNIGVGTATPSAFAGLEIAGNLPVLMPRLAADPPAGNSLDGMIFYNTATGRVRVRQGGAWVDAAGGAGNVQEWGIVNANAPFLAAGFGIVSVTRPAGGRYRVVTTRALANRAVMVTQNDVAAQDDRIFGVDIVNATTFDIFCWDLKAEDAADPDDVFGQAVNMAFAFITTGN